MGTVTQEVFDKPVGKKTRKKRVKPAKSRLHVYINDETITRIDQRAAEMGLNRSNTIQVMINYGLANFKVNDV